MIRAAEEGHIEIVHALLAAGAVKEKANNDGNTASSLATAGCHTEIAALLAPPAP